MGHATVRWTTLIATLLAAGGAARAAETADGLPKLNYQTAYTVGANTLQLGLLAFNYGLNGHLDIGVDPPYWLARSVIPVLIPNLHVKETVLDQGPVTLSVQVSGYWALLQTTSADSASLIAAPLALFASFRLLDRLWLHGEGDYVYARAFGSGDFNKLHLGGAVASQTVQVGAKLEWRLARIFSLTATGRYQVYTADLAFQASSNVDPYTTASVDGRAMAMVSHPWEAIGGVAFLWEHVHLILGAGYGYYFVPGVAIAYPKRTFVPDGNLAVVIQL
ncbi:MAG TPA: hypothetical protein VN853_00240 [Polyangia bacterium]|nr:hypothetical protein [Polyangia bacterium]